MFILFVSEFHYYLSKDVQQELFVDTSKGQKLKINVDVTFSKVGCACKSNDSVFILRAKSSHAILVMFSCHILKS
jgi:endoplasmic reticulum-Golgi intermediate compartment protein 3